MSNFSFGPSPIAFRLHILRAALCLLAACASTSVLQAQSAPPPTERHDVTEVFYGQSVTDPYRWLENWREGNGAAWLKEQDTYTRSALNSIPGREKFLARVKALDTASTHVRNAQIWGGKLFYLKADPGADNVKLYVKSGNAPERLLLDPELLTKDGVHSSIDYFQPSLDGALVAYGISPGGSEDSVIHILQTDTGKQLPDAIDRARFGGVQWLPGDKSFVYNRLQKLTPDMPRTAFEQRSRVYVHELGHQDPEQDRFIFGWNYSSDLKIDDNDLSFVTYTPGSSYLLGILAHGTQNEATAYYVPIDQLNAQHIVWKKLFDVDANITNLSLRNDDVYLLTHKNKPRYEVTRTSLKNPDVAHATVVVPASEVVIQEADVAADAVYIRDLDGGIDRMRRLSFDGKIEPVSAGEGQSTSELSVTPTESGALIHAVSWTTSPRWLKYDTKTKAVTDTGIQPPLPVDTSAYTAEEVKAKSADGTMIPVSVIHAKNITLDGNRPTHLIGYGAYGISYDAFFDPVWIAWLERGGVIAFAHVRGGGEYGEEWYRAGYKLTKQHTIDDFIAAAQYLIETKYTNPQRLSGEGTSAGGILIGGAITQRPDLFAGALIRVGCSNATRMEFTPNGPPNIAEFGSVADPDGFKGLFAMDAYQHVKDGTAYPGVLLTAGINDPRVDPMQPAKMTARLQAATSSKRPVLLRVDYDAGHGMGSTRSQHDLEYADEMSFLLWQFGDPDFQPREIAKGN
ncbi:MAG: prolyl oligopeptidase family serine peptidase [Candidatus Sulfotelmatobacter sp.]